MNTRVTILLLIIFIIQTQAQGQLYVGPASTLYVAAGNTLQVDSLSLTPAANLALSGSFIGKKASPEWAPGSTGTTIRQVYTIDTSIVFQGTASIKYAAANLNGNSVASLVMLKAPNPSDSLSLTPTSTSNPATHIVSAVFSTPLRLGKLSATSALVGLPITVRSFDAWPEGNFVRIQWEVSGENQVYQYLLERAADGVKFYPLASVPASGQDQYLLWDKAPLTPNNYYRLSAISKSGATSSFGVRKVVYRGFSAGMQLSAWPLPVTDELQVSFSEIPPKDAEIRLCDISGRVVLQQKPAERHLSITVSNLSAGVYLLHYISQGVSQTVRIEKN